MGEGVGGQVQQRGSRCEVSQRLWWPGGRGVGGSSGDGAGGAPRPPGLGAQLTD